MTLHVASLFTGVGGIDLAFERAGAPARLMCEYDKAARGVLARRFPGVPIHHDVRELTHHDLTAAGLRPDTTIVTGGFPCQDLSLAGARRGMGHGTRSGLFWHIIRLLADFRAAWVVLENVPGLLSSHGGRDMGAVLGALADRGYGFAYRVLDAQFFGVPQRRRRVVIVGRLGDSGAAPARVLLEPEGGDWDSAAGVTSGEVPAARAARGVVAALSASGVGTCGADDNQAQAGHLIAFDPKAGGDSTSSGAFEDGTGITPTLGGSRPHAIASDTQVRRLTPLECERLQGFPDGWTAGQADSPRYRQMGNAVAVPVFEWVARRVIAEDSRMRRAA